MAAQLLSGLNAAQRAAVTSRATVLQVLAPPGSGKTKTLTCKVAYLLAHEGLNPQNVICCTFIIKASREMRERLRGLVGPELEAKLVLGTFHSICRRYLVAYGHLVGIPKGFGIADSSDSLSIIKRIVKTRNLSIEPKAARSKISKHKAQNKRLDDLPKTPPKQVEKQEFITVFHEYEAALATSKLLDYDDLLLRCVDLLRTFPGCVTNVQALLIDEFQDTNIVQFELMKLLASAARKITIVGDPDQSIYGFRSAEIENLRRMKTSYPETVVINLEENYRSASAVLKLAQDVIEQDTNRPQKRLKATHCHGTQPVLRRLPNPNEEALWIVSEIKRMTTMTGGLLQHSDFAILLRSAYLSLLIEKALTSSGIPYRMVGGQRFFDRAEIRIIIDYLRTISHPDNNQALVSIINTPSRKIGETTVAELLKLGEERNLSLWAVVQKVLAGDLSFERKLTKPAQQELGRLVTLIKNGRKKVETLLPATVPSNLIDYVVKALGLEDYLKKKYKDDHEDRLENVKELITHASEVLLQPSEEELATVDGLERQAANGGQDVLAQFLANISLSTDRDNSQEGNDKPRVTISTIHSAKGLEWPAVFIPAVYEGSIPHSRSEDTDEERRLLYVAMTRAQALLTMSIPLTQSRDQTETTLTQFLPTKVHHHLSQSGPLFNDKTIQDIANILRRQPPSQEDLVKGLQSMSESDSAKDDVWPADGSRRPTAMFSSNFQEAAAYGMPLAEAVAAAQKQHYSQYSGPGLSTSYGMSTTMSDLGAFSTSNMSVGFVTAGHQLKSNPPALGRSSSVPDPPSKKPKLAKASSAQGSIATFFSKTNIQAVPLPPPVLPAISDQQLYHGRQPPVFSASFSGLHQPPHAGEMPIPKELAAHRLNHSNNAFSQKRPYPLKEANVNAKKRYVNLYSSSPPPPDLDERAQPAAGDKENPITIDSIPTKQNEPVPGQASAPLKDYVLNRPATTMHTTSMSSIGRDGLQTAGSGATMNRGKTLGVRRTFNGWDNRKNK
ncbi:ATP-dependent DNA helicase srs2 [Elasticomyces elasticus]|uniref:DNA 3'-5' helicase n=1 Tax=Exophiala sideris TaxID=1016849 RepID=A0ABR0J9V6_9EURO|nr:ATP-dependent DNA helicase srs2 [Elasticomyces elasticus]KAK5026105.1 ATP-dependent DNA helicase srs2 [Exophiala sideris]KAK5032359.1 ATP-dependent DNA helicase srs2 [Exophiala sideris]KAK5059515.1 ATP-dependent DNA helicase srs2 [Exophiala sideris]KAK5186677.1 ATP-dependent DNA helicase srs2 [Eurotiomycetes sp. CCFEE 6388]